MKQKIFLAAVLVFAAAAAGGLVASLYAAGAQDDYTMCLTQNPMPAWRNQGGSGGGTSITPPCADDGTISPDGDETITPQNPPVNPYYDCRCRQTAPGNTEELLTHCCKVKDTTYHVQIFTGDPGGGWDASKCKTPCSAVKCPDGKVNRGGNYYKEDVTSCCVGAVSLKWVSGALTNIPCGGGLGGEYDERLAPTEQQGAFLMCPAGTFGTCPSQGKKAYCEHTNYKNPNTGAVMGCCSGPSGGLDANGCGRVYTCQMVAAD